ncbi:uncharacterized protein LOC111999776 [Quercus suber]|uniref:uncharacterized protein LOC111999776 n=1 Tax=Quercus suber TaxID=58331 RepID=UPI000CE167BC|nr:uncharacterized protein LOC111999776 isoform X1 [Quercus suber]POE67144.1 small heat shock protein c2 [Quercus suber]
MEIQAARRRINLIAAHFSPTDDISVTNVLPMNCSSSLNSVPRRCDNRMFFARQGSVSQANFMRQATIEENCSSEQATIEENCNSSLNSVIQRCDNRMFFARQGSVSQAKFMRQATTEEINPAESDLPLKPSGYKGSYNDSEAPLFSRPVKKEPDFANVAQPVVQGCMLAVPEPPKFAGPGRRTSGRIEWSPRMDVAESGCNYVVTVEIPGVNRHDIRVEIDDQKLTVQGIRSTQYWKVSGFSNDSISAYHKQEILQGPYQVVWPLPANVNKDSVSAEFLDGFLQIIIPKI